MSGADATTHRWREFRGRRLQGLVRRAELLAWLRASPTHLELSAAEIGRRCPLYHGVTDTYRTALGDLRVMEDYHCWVSRDSGRPNRWSVTALGARAVPQLPSA
jgi:hypothetical protein